MFYRKEWFPNWAAFYAAKNLSHTVGACKYFVLFFDLISTYFVDNFIHHDCLVGALLLMNVECILLNSINDLDIASAHVINQVITMIKWFYLLSQRKYFNTMVRLESRKKSLFTELVRGVHSTKGNFWVSWSELHEKEFCICME